jgi:hypothetical protein
MKKIAFLLFSLFTALALVFVACSDNATEPELTEGDYQDPNYQTARMITESIVDTLFMEADAASDFINFDGSEPMQASDSLLITFDEETCWWHIYVGADTTNASLLFVDSLKFQDAEGCQMFPDSFTTTSIEYRAYLDIDLISDSATIVATANENLLLEGIQDDTCVINATAASNLELASSLYEISYDYSGALDDIKFLTLELMNEEDPRPVAGTMILNLIIFGSNQQGSGSWNWAVIITFNEGGYHARAESGENYWEWDVTYVT